jgi:hypothetical protein
MTPQEPQPPDINTQVFERFPSVSLLSMLALSLLTLGIYGWWWLYSRSLILNGLLPPKEMISKNFISLILAGFGITLIAAFISATQTDNTDLKQATDVLSLVLNVLVIVWVFRFRRGLLFLLGEKLGESAPNTRNVFHVNVVWTFLLSVFYLQKKINDVCAHGQVGVM